jgi:predicted nucleic acid-binding protein
MGSPVLRLLGEGPGYWEHLRSLVVAGTVSGPQVHDARIAALCIQHRVSCLWTADRDFSRFPSLPTRNPLVTGY